METPELNRMQAIQPKSEIIGEFLDWLFYEKNLNICEMYEGLTFQPLYKSPNNWLAEYFGIDLDKVDQEQKAILQNLRQQREDTNNC